MATRFTRRFVLVLFAFTALAVQWPAAFADGGERPLEFEVMVPMRDGTRLKTWVNLPAGEGPFPVVLVRTPYQLSINARHGPPLEAYLDAGYAMVWQISRGMGDSEGSYRFVADSRLDGYDCIEWIASQPWSDGNVGMDHGSYNGLTQLQAASQQPEALKAIIPFVPSSHFFRETPYAGGIFMRYHMLNWHKLSTLGSFEESDVGFMDAARVIDDPEWQRMLNHRPIIDSANGFLEGDQLAQFRAFLQQDTLDEEYWPQVMMMDEHYARVGIPVLLVTGNFDPSTGTIWAWKQLEKHAPNPQNRKLLIGPWTHGTSYYGLAPEVPPYDFAGQGSIDMSAMRIAFFDRYLKGLMPQLSLPQRVRVFITGSNVWREFDNLPVPSRKVTTFHLASQGRANSARGNGTLQPSVQPGEASDTVRSDPRNPVVAISDTMVGVTDYSETHENPDVLVYDTPPLPEPLTFVGESRAVIYVSATTPDADLAVAVHEVYPDGKVIRLGFGGALRLRYREGFDRQVLMEPGEVYEVEIPMAYAAHTLAAGNRLRFTVSATEFPMLDPNPNTGEKIATAVRMQVSDLTIHHNAGYPTRIELPVVDL